MNIILIIRIPFYIIHFVTTFASQGMYVTDNKFITFKYSFTNSSLTKLVYLQYKNKILFLLPYFLGWFIFYFIFVSFQNTILMHI